MGFEFMDESHSGYNIKGCLHECCKKYHLLEKVFSPSTDDAMTNIKAIDYLKQKITFKLILDGRFLHVRCCSHILNICVQGCIVCLQPLLEPIRIIVN